MKTNKLVYIETFGCQMNERDSEIMRQLLAGINYLPTNDLPSADLIIINTCSIRAKAEQKVYSLLGRLRKLKKDKPALLIAVAGCVAQQEGKKIIERMPQVDIVVGTQHIYRLPELVGNAERRGSDKKSRVITELATTFKIPSYIRPADHDGTLCRDKPSKRFVTIMQGCNNFCTYCVVPHTRGREVSRPAADILAEINDLARKGVKEITLLGQNVNSYGNDTNGKGMSFPALLRLVAGVEGIKRIRFTTSHPKDLSAELIGCFAEIDKLSPYFHLPVQSGSNRTLKRMNRKYTVEAYLEKVMLLRQARPDIAIGTDLIVGFPGESDEDFEATMNLIETVRYHNVFSFKYSDRPMTRSIAFADKVPEDEKNRRLARLQARQHEITLERNREYVGRSLTVMVEGESKMADGQWSGRSDTNHIVNFYAAGLTPRDLPAGKMIVVKIEEGCLHSLRGVLAS